LFVGSEIGTLSRAGMTAIFSICSSGNELTHHLRFENGDAFDVDLVDYH
jgi:hypothetical protein